MSNELISIAGLPEVPFTGDDKSFLDLIESTSFLPRVQLCGANSGLVKESKTGGGRYGLIRGNEVEDLGNQIDILPIAWRFKAMRAPGNGEVGVHFDPRTAEYKGVVADSEDKDSGCFHGIEFLCWLPSHLIFVTFFFNSKSSRREAPNMKALLRRGVTMKVNLARKAKYMWHVPVIVGCSTPFPMPDDESVRSQVDRFVAQTKQSTAVEKADADVDASRER